MPYEENTGLLIIATGEKYHKYIQPLLASARTYFVPHTPIIFSDAEDIGCAEHPFMRIPHEHWPGPTLHRYGTFLRAWSFLHSFDHLFYIDVDMLFVAPVGKEIFSDGITATLHPGYVGTPGTPERNTHSAAYIPSNARNQYFCGGFNGGTMEAFMEMTDYLDADITRDERLGITAIWHDESHLNKYLWDNPPAKTLDPSYCYPENAGAYYIDKWKHVGLNVTPKIIALEKK
jgi:hypothetical protein